MPAVSSRLTASPVRISERPIKRAALSTVITGNAWEKVEEELDGRIGADSAEPLAPCGRERVDPSRGGVGVGARTCCRRSERAQPLVGAS